MYAGIFVKIMFLGSQIQKFRHNIKYRACYSWCIRALSDCFDIPYFCISSVALFFRSDNYFKID